MAKTLTRSEASSSGFGVDAEAAKRLLSEMFLIRRFEEKAAEAYARKHGLAKVSVVPQLKARPSGLFEVTNGRSLVPGEAGNFPSGGFGLAKNIGAVPAHCQRRAHIVVIHSVHLF